VEAEKDCKLQSNSSEARVFYGTIAYGFELMLR